MNTGNSGNWHWLRDCALPQLQRDGLIPAETDLGRLRAYCDSQCGASSQNATRTILLLSIILGAGLVAAGIILLLAWNWNALPRPVRVCASLAPLLISSILGGHAIRSGKGAAWREPSGVAMGASIATAIALVSQIYNCDGCLGDFMAVVLPLCTAMAWLLRSRSLAIAAMLFYPSMWAGSGSVIPSGMHYAICLAIGVALLVFLGRWLARTGSAWLSTTLHAVMAYGMTMVPLVLLSHGDNSRTVVAPAMVMASGMMMLWWNRTRGSFDASSMTAFPAIIMALILFLINNSCQIRNYSYRAAAHTISWPTWITALIIGAAIAALLFWRHRRRVADWIYASIWLFGMVMLLLHIDKSAYIYKGDVVTIAWCAIALSLLIISARRHDLPNAIVGLLMLLELSIDRFYSSDWGMLWRGGIFVASGIATLAIAVFLFRHCAARDGKEAHHE